MADDTGQESIDRDEMEEMLSIGEAADFIGVSVDTLRRWSKKERVTTYRSPGGHRYYKKKDLRGLFDTKYTRDEPTERSSKDESEKDQAPKEEPEEKSEERDSDDVVIPKMQPVKVISEVENANNYPIPDLMTPPPPMPTMPQTQTHTHMEVQTMSVDQTRSQHRQTQQPGQQQQYYRQPAAPIQSPQQNGQKPSVSSDTVISDHTQPASRQPAQPMTQQARQEQTDHQPEPVQTQQLPQKPEGEFIPPRQDESTQSSKTVSQQEQHSQEDDEPTTHFTPPWRQVTEASEQETKQRSEPEPTESEAQKETDPRPSEKEQEVQQPQEEKKEDKLQQEVKTKEKETETQKEEDRIAKAFEQAMKAETTEPEPKKAEEKPDDHQDKVQEKPKTEERIEKVQKKKQEEKKKSILEPEHGVDASKLNQIEKADDEGWFARNKSNILIGFTVFLLIDIILFVIWLTTSRLLSPIP